MNMILEKREVPGDLRKTFIKTLHKKDDKSEWGYYWGSSLVSVQSKLLTMTIFVRIEDVVDKVLRKELYGFRKGRGCVDQIIT